MNEIYAVITKLEDTSSRNEKIEILKQNKDLPYLKEFFQYALDPMKVYGIKKVPEITTTEWVTDMESLLNLFDMLGARKFTGNSAIEQVRIALGGCDERGKEIIRRIIAKDPKCGVQESTVNKVWGKGTIPKFDVMLCAGKNEKTLKKMNWPAIAQIKYDGLRVVFIVDPTSKSVTAHTRSGRVIETFGIFDDYLLDMSRRLGFATMFDGEMIAYDEDGELVARKTSNGIMTKAVKGTATKEMLEPFVFVCWDAVPVDKFKEGKWNMPYKDRYNALNEAATHQVFGGRVEIPESRTLNQEEVETYFEEVIEEGLEGLIVKDPTKGWEAKRVDHHIKYKAELEMDLEIIQVCEGSGKYRGLLGHVICATKDRGLVVGVGSGFSDEQREQYYTDDIVGKIMAVKYNEIIDKKDQEEKSLFLPIFVEIREDKNEADVV